MGILSPGLVDNLRTPNRHSGLEINLITCEDPFI